MLEADERDHRRQRQLPTTPAARRSMLGGSGGPVLVDGNQAGDRRLCRATATARSPSAVADRRHRQRRHVAERRRARRDRRRRAAASPTRATSSTASPPNFVDGVNAVQAQGRDLDGNAGAAMFATGASAGTARSSVALDRPARHRRGGGRRRRSATTAISPRSQTLRTTRRVREQTRSTLVTTNAAALAQRKRSPTRRARSATTRSPRAMRCPASISTPRRST